MDFLEVVDDWRELCTVTKTLNLFFTNFRAFFSSLLPGDSVSWKFRLTDLLPTFSMCLSREPWIWKFDIFFWFLLYGQICTRKLLTENCYGFFGKNREEIDVFRPDWNIPVSRFVWSSSFVYYAPNSNALFLTATMNIFQRDSATSWSVPRSYLYTSEHSRTNESVYCYTRGISAIRNFVC